MGRYDEFTSMYFQLIQLNTAGDVRSPAVYIKRRLVCLQPRWQRSSSFMVAHEAAGLVKFDGQHERRG
jgi:hypothetical protein